MRFDILTLFPDYFTSPLEQSLLKRGRDRELIEVNTYNISHYSTRKHHKVDDCPYGGGPGMVMGVDPIVRTFEAVERMENSRCIFLSPQGKRLDQEKVEELATYDQLILLCGHYEGVDERAIDLIIDEEISIGDYILTGGESGALVLIDSVSRYVEGVVGKMDSVYEDSLSEGLLKYPQYTMPRSFRGLDVPPVLLSGHHGEIKKWRDEMRQLRTKNKRPDLWEKYLKRRDNK